MKQGRNILSIGLIYTFVAILTTGEPVLAQTSEPILSIEVGTHSAGIMRIALDSSNRILVTGSEDKTVRVWDISNRGELLRILRPPVDAGNVGRINSVALSPDGGTVACGGFTGSPQAGDAWVFLFDRTTGAMTRRLGGLPWGVRHLSYTKDGRFLVVAMGKGGIRLYRLPDYTLIAADFRYTDTVEWVESDPTGSRLATSGWDGFVRLYDLSSLAAPDGSSSRPIAPVSKLRPPGGKRPWGLAFTADGARLAVGHYYTAKLDILDVKGNTLEYAFSPDTKDLEGSSFADMDLRAVAWSNDGRFLYAGGSLRSKGVRQIRKWADGGRGQSTTLSAGSLGHIFQILPTRAGGLVFGARDGSFGVLNDRGESTLFVPPAIPNYQANLERFFLSQDSASVQFGYEPRGKLTAIFSVNERRLTDSLSILWASFKAAFTFHKPITEGLEVTDWKGSESPKLNGKPLPMKNETATSLAILPDRSAFLLGTVNNLRLFDAAGKAIWRTPLHTAAHMVNTNGQVAVAGLYDGTIRWYRLTDGREILALFPHPDRKRWILWTPSGYYDAASGGEGLIGWHLNNGPDRAADFFPASRLRSTYYRPDVIDRVLKTLDEAVALQQANDESGRKQVADASVREKLPPVVTITSPADGADVSGTPVKVSYTARSSEPLSGLKILVDGRPIPAESVGKSVKESGDISVPIPSRDCEISVIAENRNAASEPATVRLRWKGAAAAKEEFQIKPKLYILAVGVSQYQDTELRLGLAAKDALDFSTAWTAQKGRLYSGVEARVLADAQATKGNILDGLEWLQRQVTQKDIAVLFLAGHGINDPNGVFYFLPVDADLERLKRTGISQADITSTVTMIAGKVLVFIDACHSGNLMGKTKRRGLVVSSGAVVNELASAENGAVVFSSSTGRQYSQEKPEWGNGAFTKGLVEGLSGKADYRSTGRITVNMLDLYVSERVKELTEGQQTPTTVKPPNVPDFPVVVLR
ncbi:MAG: caspase family protein [Syntrophales bacterium]|nr:caspase family protein [Syntrophales bacterium]